MVLDPNKKILMDRVATRMRTAFIGALDAFEKEFPELVHSGEFQAVRKHILDLGNNQIRGMASEMEYFDIKLNGKYMILNKDDRND